MAELEDVTLDGKPLHSLRVADLKAALEQRGLAKSGQKNALIKRLKGALMLENLQRTSTSHTGLQPNSQIGEEMSQNSFIKQYLAKQQELLRQRMEREAREAAEADDTKSPAGPDKDEHTAANDNSSYLPDKHHIVASRASVHRSEDDREGEQLDAHRADAGTASVSQSSPDATTGKTWCPSFSQEETATPSPPRAVASLSVRVVGHPERQGVPLIVPRPQEKEGTAPVEAGPAHPMPQLSRSARAQDDSDDEEDDDDEDSDEDDDWGPSSRRKKNVRVTPQRSRRKLQPPQHIPPHHSPLQLRQPTPPPSPPPELSFPLPDTPKQSPPDQDEPEAPVDNSVSSSPSPQRQESTSSSRSSSPEPPPKRRLGPLGLLVLKMESEVAKKKEEEEHAAAEEQPEAGKEVVQDSKEAIVNDRCDAEMTPDGPSSSEKALPDVCESVPAMPFAAESSPQELVKAKKEPKDEKEQEDKQKGKDHEKLPESANLSLKREREASPSHESPSLHHSSPTTSLPGVTKRKRIFSEVPPPEWLASPSKPKQVSVLMSGPHHASADVDMEAEASAPISLIEQNKEEIKETELAKSPKESAEEMEVEKLAATQGSEEAENKKAEIEHVASSLETKTLVENKSESEKAAPEDLASSNELASSQTSGAAEKMKTIRLVSRATEEIIHAPQKPQTSAESERLVAPLESVASPATGVIKPVSETPEGPHRAAKPALEVHEGETGTSKATEEIKEKMASSLAFRAELKMDSATKIEVVTEKLKSSEASKAGEEMVEATKKVAPPQSSERAEEIKGAEQVASAPVSEATEEMKVAETEQRAAQQSFQAAEEMKDAETEKPGSSQTADPAADPMEDKAEASEEMLEAEAPQKHASPCPVDSDEEMQEAEPEKQGSRPASEDSVLLPPSPPREKEKLITTKEKSRRRKSSSSSQSSSSDSDSGSSSSSSSSSSTSSSREKANPPSHKQDEEEKSRQTDKVKEKTSREVKQATVAEPTAPVSMELQEQPESESALAHPASQEAPETSESRTDEITTPKVIAARKISLITSKPDGATVEAESASGAGRKRRWGSSTAVTAKKPSISITTESLKSLIPDLKPLQEAVVDLHPDEGRFSGDEEATQQTERNEDEGLQIRRTVTQVVPTEGQENGQKEKEEEEEDDEPVEDKEEPIRKPRRESSSEVAMETQEADTKKVTPNDSVVRRSISQQKVAVSITIDDPVRTGRQLSPPRGKTSNIIHICNLVRPFTLGQLKELLNRTGAVVDEGFWIDKIKSHCYVTYSSTEEAVATREALHGVKWPSSNPKVLRVDFCEKDELDFHKGLLPGEVPRAPPAPTRPAAPPPLLPPTREKEREREREGGAPAARDQWAEREREMERRERTRSEREWDRDKVRDFNRDERDAAKRSRSREKDRRRKERGKSKEKKSEKKDKPEEPPAKLLDDLFRKTKAAPCIYWLPLTEEQTNQRSQDRAERLKEREKIRKELEEEDKKREEERKERARGRERDAANPASGGGNSNRPTEGEKDKEREKERERDRAREKEGERRRDGNRARGGDSRPAGGARRSRSHSNPSRDRRR